MDSKEILLTAEDILVGHSKIKNPKKLEQIYEGYKKSYFVNSHYSTIYLADEELWTFKANDRTWLFYHHSLVSVSFLIDSYYIDKKEDKLNLAYEIVGK
ncbi:hypothetical protein [Priestia megaterium]|uniref:hypothetical protein n=1 Tax=Priestia megaterium TaxID=1404 RepID=UPI0004727F47|nr:hypothetical protein [Priestia megaterium]